MKKKKIRLLSGGFSADYW